MAVAPKYGEFEDGKLWFTRKNSVITLGLTTSGVEAIGQVESIEFPDEGGDFVKGEAVVTIEGSRGTLEVTTPASGIVDEVNAQAKDENNLIVEDPLEEGWLVKIEIQDKTELEEFKEYD